ncbi:hypothetical protein ZIOFF_034669 [Zingiber officinale]|uniref:Uncharacterized protein n=1 Tax=Zingiber officinale TaxID=94328 RepID=A0A8J5GJQ3_ZINOF|nr:hypothetical protein ZIOFF_034669 [Zingiber officinale]
MSFPLPQISTKPTRLSTPHLASPISPNVDPSINSLRPAIAPSDDRADFIPEADLLPPSQLSPISARSWGQKGSLSPSPSYSFSSCFLPTRATEMNGAGPFD